MVNAVFGAAIALGNPYALSSLSNQCAQQMGELHHAVVKSLAATDTGYANHLVDFGHLGHQGHLEEVGTDDDVGGVKSLGDELVLQQEAVDMSDLVLEIPQWGTKHSLNVSVAVGVILWHFRP